MKDSPPFLALVAVVAVLCLIYLAATKSQRAKRLIGAGLGLLVLVSAAWWIASGVTVLAR